MRDDNLQSKTSGTLNQGTWAVGQLNKVHKKIAMLGLELFSTLQPGMEPNS